MQAQHMLEEEGAQLEEQGRGCKQTPGQAMGGNTAQKLYHLVDLTEKTVAELEQSRGQKERARMGPYGINAGRAAPPA
ncbi:hypothetical protein KAM385_30380 [Aeromonas hydrophila]|nr:hypothetical protein KAM385_30380 [Aeromonas hydrophila]